MPPSKSYDLIVDSYCLQSIVLDEDRRRLFAAVRARLKPTGRYLISTAMYDPARDYASDGRRDEATGIVHAQDEGAWVPHRRHLTPDALARELDQAGFQLIWQGGQLGGDVMCALR